VNIYEDCDGVGVAVVAVVACLYLYWNAAADVSAVGIVDLFFGCSSFPHTDLYVRLSGVC